VHERSSIFTYCNFCRLNLQGMQNDCDMIPLMVQSNFKPKGWLGLILGTRLWCKSFYTRPVTCRPAIDLSTVI
jgi:hypothetical protein